MNGPVRIVRWGELRRILNFWRLRHQTGDGIRVTFYRRASGQAVICRITLAVEDA